MQEVAERLLELCAYDKAALLLCALREAHEARRGALTGFASLASGDPCEQERTLLERDLQRRAAAKAEASVAHSELKAAKAEAALISQKCDSLELMLAEAQQSAAERAVAAPIMAADRSDPELPSRMQLEAWWNAASEGRKRAEEDANRQRKRAEDCAQKERLGFSVITGKCSETERYFGVEPAAGSG